MELLQEDWSPMPPSQGPPLPKFLKVYWPWYSPAAAGGTAPGAGTSGGQAPSQGEPVTSYGPLKVTPYAWTTAQGWRTLVIQCSITNLSDQTIKPDIKAVYQYTTKDQNGQTVTGQGTYDFGTFTIGPKGVGVFSYDGRNKTGPTLLFSWSGGGSNPPINYTIHLTDSLGGSSDNAQFSV